MNPGSRSEYVYKYTRLSMELDDNYFRFDADDIKGLQVKQLPSRVLKTDNLFQNAITFEVDTD